MKTLPSSGGSWSSSLTVSASSETAALPSIVVVGDDTWVSYETVAAFTGAHSVRVSKIDSAGSVDRTLVSSTSYTASVYTWIHTDGRHLWIDWIDSSTLVGYSEYVDGVWSEPAYQSYDGVKDIKAARDRIAKYIRG